MIESVILVLQIVVGLLSGVLLLRFWMQAVRVRPPQQVAQFTFQLSDWLVRPLRRVVPGFGGYDWASLVGAYLVELLLVAIKLWLFHRFSVETMLIQSLLYLLQSILYCVMFLLFLEVVFSWVNPHAPMAPLVRALNMPLLRPLRRIVPPIGSVDLTILVAFIVLQILLRQVASYLIP